MSVQHSRFIFVLFIWNVYCISSSVSQASEILSENNDQLNSCTAAHYLYFHFKHFIIRKIPVNLNYINFSEARSQSHRVSCQTIYKSKSAMNSQISQLNILIFISFEIWRYDRQDSRSLRESFPLDSRLTGCSKLNYHY